MEYIRPPGLYVSIDLYLSFDFFNIPFFPFELDEPDCAGAFLSIKLFGEHLMFMAFPVNHAPFHPLMLKPSFGSLENLMPIAVAFFSALIAIKISRQERGMLIVDQLVIDSVGNCTEPLQLFPQPTLK